MSGVCVERQKQRWSALDNPNASVGMPMDAALVPLGKAEGALQVQVVEWKVEIVAAREQSRPEGLHRAGHVLLDRVQARVQPCCKIAEPPPSLGVRTGRGVKGVLDRA